MMTPQQVNTEINRLVDQGGDEQALERFFLDNYIDLPEAMQRDVLFAFYTDALERKVGITKMQRQGLAMAEKIGAYQAALQEG